MKIYNSHVGISDAQVSAIERMFDCTLPNDYIEYLHLYNGGVPSRQYFTISGLSQNPYGDVLYFYGFHTGARHDDVLLIHPNLLQRLDPGVIPIAASSCGRLVVLSCKDPEHAGVFYRDEDEVTDDAFSGLFFVAPSFSDFLNSLRDATEDELSH